MKKKIGRNDLCWCGSGKKYKKCHLYRINEKIINKNELFSMYKKIPPRMCCSPKTWHVNCTKIILSHTVSEKSLKHIACNGHVYAINKTLNTSYENEGRLKYKKIGINRATVIECFCSFHDNNIFAYIENSNFVYNAESSFLLFYRAFCYEYHSKIFQNNSIKFNKNMDKGKSIEEQIRIQYHCMRQQEFNNIAIFENENYKLMLDSFLIDRNFDNILSVCFTIPSPPAVMAAGGISLVYDMKGRKIFNDSNIYDERPRLILNSFYDGKVGRFIFSSICSDKKYLLNFLNSIFEYNGDYINIISQYIIRNIENHVISCSIFEKLSHCDINFLEEEANAYVIGFNYNPKIIVDDTSIVCIETINCSFYNHLFS